MGTPRRPVDPEELLRNAGWVRALARRLVLDDHRAEDVVQQAWLAALETGPREGVPVRPWLARVARNLSLKVLRSEGRRSRHEGCVPPPSPPPDPEEGAARAEAFRRVVDAVYGLEEPYRSTVLLRYFEGLEAAAIARRQGAPVETVRTRLKRALALLRRTLDPGSGGDRRALVLALLGPDRPAAGPPGAPLAPGGPATAGGAAALLGGLLMAKKTLVAAAVVLLAVGGWALQSRIVSYNETGVPRPSEEPAGDPPGPARVPGREAGPATPGAREAASAAPRAGGRVVDANGRPVAGATVRAIPGRFRAGFRQDDDPTVPPVQSGPGGEFDLRLPDTAPFFTLLAEASGHSPATAERVRPGEEVVLALGATRTLRGRVLDARGAPVPGARVRWIGRLPSLAFFLEAASGVGGRYALPGIPTAEAARAAGFGDGSCLAVDASGYAPLTVAWDPGEHPGEEPVFDLHLGVGATLVGRVVDGETEAPLPGVEVHLWTYERPRVEEGRGALLPLSGRRESATTVSDETGGFRFEGIPAEGLHPLPVNASGARGVLLGAVGAVVPGYALASDEVPVPLDGATVEVEILCWPAAAIAGRVVDREGRPQEGVDVVAISRERRGGWLPGPVEGAPPRSVPTGADGRYLLPGVVALRGEPSAVTVVASVPGRDTMAMHNPTAEVQVRAGSRTEAPDLVVDEGGVASVLLRVTDGEGRPVWGAGACWTQLGPEAFTDRGGRARFWFTYDRAGMPPRPVTLVVRAAGFAPAATGVFTPSVEAPPEVAVVLGPARRLEGRVARADGSPAGGVTVWAVDSSVPPDRIFPKGGGPILGVGGPPPPEFPPLSILGTATTGEDGSFALEDLPEGTCNLLAGVPPITASASRIATGAIGVVLTLPPEPPRPTAVVEAVVTAAATGLPVPRVTALLLREGPDGRTTWANGTNPSPGVYRWSAIAAGKWLLRVTAPGYASFEREVEAEEGRAGPLQVAVALERGATVRGRLTAPPGVETRDLLVLFLGEGGSEWSGTGTHGQVRADGTYEATGLRPGRWRIAVRRPAPGEPYFAPWPPAEVTVPGEGGDLLRDVRVVPAGILGIHLEAGPDAVPDPAAVGIEVRDPSGRTAWEGRFHESLASWVLAPLPPGSWTVRVALPDGGAMERTVSLSEGGRADALFRIP